MLITTKGYLINRNDYNDFDEIITIINEYGLKFKCYCLGTRKILSKNARNLDYGNFCEFSFFYSKINYSKLKKVNTLSYLENDLKFNIVLNILNDYYYQMSFNSKKFYELYQDIILYLIKQLNEFLIIIFLCIKIINLNGLILDFNICQICNLKFNLDYLNLKYNGLICKHCSTKVKHNLLLLKPYLLLLKQIQNNELEISLININDYDISILRKICIQLMFFIYENLNIYSNFLHNI